MREIGKYLRDGNVGIAQVSVLSDNGNTDFRRNLVNIFSQFLSIRERMHLYLPARQIRFFIGNLEYLQDVFSSLLLSQHQGNVIDVADVMNTQHVRDRDIAERGDLLLGFLHINLLRQTHTGSRGLAVLQIKKSGDKPVARSSFTVVCVGLVFCSLRLIHRLHTYPTTPITGTRLT